MGSRGCASFTAQGVDLRYLLPFRHKTNHWSVGTQVSSKEPSAKVSVTRVSSTAQKTSMRPPPVLAKGVSNVASSGLPLGLF